jgi:hypothetical protein
VSRATAASTLLVANGSDKTRAQKLLRIASANFLFCGKSAEGQQLKLVSATDATPYSNSADLLAEVARLAF